MKLYSTSEYTQVPWEETRNGKRLKSYFKPFFENHTRELISNVTSNLYILKVNDLLIPITVNEKEYSNSYVCSIYSYILYAEEEMIKHKRHLLRIFCTPILALTKQLFKWAHIDRIVSVNNHFLSTNLYPKLSDEELREIHLFLRAKFPRHTIIFRSLNPYLNQPSETFLKKIGYDLISFRSVCLFAPEKYNALPKKKRWNINNDRKLIQGELKILEHGDFQKAHAPRMKELYDMLYIHKHSSYNPSFSQKYFVNAMEQGSLRLRGIAYKDQLVGLIGYYTEENVMTTPVVGYDTTLPQELGLYRMLTWLMIEPALEHNFTLHWSAGVAPFKRNRGAFQQIESMAVYTKHLSLHQKMLWNGIRFLLNQIALPIVKKNKW